MVVRIGDNPTPRTFAGRFAWTLNELVQAGPKGITSLENPAPRISHYIMILRRAGVNISTEDERHPGSFSGRHGRYRLEVPVTVLETGRGISGRKVAADARRKAA
ncbi:MAG: hypothetical protein C0522_07600 [Rhodocyclaceae bacterium]|nr:hypothetical protein [Rhodocyclaceae bacterium]